MSTSRTVAVAAAFVLITAGALAADAPKFGKPISEADAAARDISIAPDGKGLPDGSGTPAQGAALYAQKCAACHGEKGEGGLGPRLVGGQGTLKAPARRFKRSALTGPMRPCCSTTCAGPCLTRSRNRSATTKSMPR